MGIRSCYRGRSRGRSEGRILVVPEVGLSGITAMVVAVDLCGVVVFEDPSRLVEELEELGGGLVGEIGGETSQWERFTVHGGYLGGHGLSSSRAAWRCSVVTDCALSRAAAVSA